MTSQPSILDEFPEDIERMNACLQKAGRTTSRPAIALAWMRYSGRLCASWLALPEDDTVLTETLLTKTLLAWLPATSNGPKRATTVDLPESLLAEASELGIDVAEAAIAGLVQAVAERRASLWQQENADAIARYNRMVEKNGLPLEDLRLF